MASNRVITGPQQEPLELEEVRRQVRQEEGIDDASLEEMISRVRAQIEAYLHRSLITQVRELVLDRFPGGCIEVDYGPVQAVLSLVYVDDADTEQTEDLSRYDVDIHSVPARVLPKFGNNWPVPGPGLNRVRLRYRAGYGDTSASIPRDITQGMLFTLAHLYENRESTVIGATAVELPYGATYYLLPHVVHGA